MMPIVGKYRVFEGNYKKFFCCRILVIPPRIYQFTWLPYFFTVCLATIVLWILFMCLNDPKALRFFIAYSNRTLRVPLRERLSSPRSMLRYVILLNIRNGDWL